MDIRMTSDLRPRQTVSAAPKSTEKQKKTNSKSKAASNVDTFESSATRVFGDRMLSSSTDKLHLEGSIPSAGNLEYFDPLEHDGIDWESLEKSYFGNQQVTLDNADQLRGSVDYIASTYVAVKSTLEEKYADHEEILAEKMDRLNGLLAKAKHRMATSYERTVGSFYSSTGNKGVASAMGSSLSAGIDKRIAEMEELSKTMKSFESGSDTTYIHRQLVLDVWGFNQREGKHGSETDSEADSDSGLESVSTFESAPTPESVSKTVSDKTKNLYSLEDLEAAGMAAKAAANMSMAGLHLMSDEELGICLASRYMKMACLLDKTGVSKEMSEMILKSFGTFLNQYSGKALSGNTGAAKAYNYTLEQFRSAKDMAEAITKGGRKYGGDGFFSDYRNFGKDVSMSLSTRYNLDIQQFIWDLENSGPAAVLPSVSGTDIHGFAAYI